MFFPVRCIFWMTVVYTSITWPGGQAPNVGDLTGAMVAKVASDARNAATDACLEAPSACAEKIVAVSHLAENIVPVPLPVARRARVVAAPSMPEAARADTLRADDRSAAPVRARRAG